MVDEKGFTIIEMIVVIAIVIFIFGISLVAGIDLYRKSSSRSEHKIILSALQKARANSMNNIGQTRHGVSFQKKPLRYILFECPQDNRQCMSYFDEFPAFAIHARYDVSIVPAPPFDIVFEGLSGNCLTCHPSTTITIRDGQKDYIINISSNGRIDW